MRHPLALLGVALATAMAALFLVLLLLDSFGYLNNPYFGLLLFIAVPAAFVLGLILIPIGARLESRRQRRSPDAPPADWPVLDLRIARQRKWLGAFVVLTTVNLVLLSMASYGAVHYMESTEFCGQVCHTSMEPQFMAHQAGPHARVPCVSCHVGPGVSALVESKMAGTRQLWQVATNNVPTPIPSPVHTLRPARDTCEQCHWPEYFHGDEARVIREYADDEQNTETVTNLTLFVGGGSSTLGVGSGIHWHMNLLNQIEYITTDDKREVIPWVQLRQPDGTVLEFVVEGTTPEQLAAGERRRMDCMDCHNRPAHTFYATPERAVNAAMAQGRIPRDLPFARREAVAAVSASYPDRTAALRAIAQRLREHYRAYPSVDGRRVERAIEATQDVWARNVFPDMKVTWGTYPNQIGHDPAPGCFRCHDDNHQTKDGRVIRQDCELCHTMT
ncbi:MAG TPA: NapC/NirT family cytochrome c [Propionibacteriaceae bacterium]|nr:NapC/NirT family cytochrome c [Propionibacteriaceae bacterium]